MPRSVSSFFISSTSQDLAPYRAKVREMIERMRETTIAMETFGARPNKPLATCRDEVRKCDALIVIVGHRYGWIPSKKDGGDGRRSITWWEVQWALDAGKPVYAFLLDPQAPWSAQREQDRLTTARTAEAFVEIGRAVQWLQEFRAFLENETTRELFDTPDNLGAKVATSLIQQAVAAARAELPAEARTPLPGLLPEPAKAAAPPRDFDELYWQEQIHLIAGRANTGHPALAEASIKQVDARSKAGHDGSDDYTTSLAALLVGAHGIAPGAELLVLQVLDRSGMTSSSDMLAAVDAAIREGAHVICLTLSGAQASESDRTIYAHAAELGVALVCAAGNSSSDQRHYPAAYPHCISVAAVDAANRLAAFSTFGDWVTIAAPGVDIPLATGEAEYRKWSGTSFACAMVAGTVALMLRANPALPVDRVKEILRSVGPRVPHATDAAPFTDFSMLDACAAVRAAPVFDGAGKAKRTRKARPSSGKPPTRTTGRRRKKRVATSR
jgi:subtilase family protein/uncharacterized protein DUF4062